MSENNEGFAYVSVSLNGAFMLPIERLPDLLALLKGSSLASYRWNTDAKESQWVIEAGDNARPTIELHTEADYAIARRRGQLRAEEKK
jgi:hypothetical protein